jgi:hypothetical protein
MFKNLVLEATMLASGVTGDNVNGKITTGLDEPMTQQQRDDLLWAARFDAAMAVYLAAQSAIYARRLYWALLCLLGWLILRDLT